MDRILCPWGGEKSRHRFKFKGKWLGIQNVVKSQTATTRMRQGLPLSLAQKYREDSREGKNRFWGHIVPISEDRDVKIINILIAHEVSKPSVAQNGDYDYKKVAILN